MIPLGLYIHIPWCIQKCPYCDFNSHEMKSETPEQRYINCLIDDLQQDMQHFRETRPIRHIFIGGGTPSLFSPEGIAALLHGIKTHANLADDAEITMEANPGTFESVKFAGFRNAGINRLSVGIQSFNDACLKRLGRIHDSAEAIKAVKMAKQVGFDNINLDLMFGLPDASPGTSLNDVETAINLGPKHISFYQLTLEPNTYFHKYPPQLPGQDQIITEQTDCQTLLEAHGFKQYEISAYSQPGFACRHNVNYWQFGDYLGIGAGAHGKISSRLPDQIIRYQKPKKPETYMQRVYENAFDRAEQKIAKNELALEFVMNHLRLRQGFDIQTLHNKTGMELKALQPALTDCIDSGLIETNGHRFYCSDQGWNFLDSVLQEFMPD